MSLKVEDVQQVIIDKTTLGGAAGAGLTYYLEDINLIVAIAVGIVTFLYVSYKLVTAIIDRRKASKK